MPIAGSVGLALLFGSLMGGVSRYLVANRKMPPFVVTLGMMTIARGTAFIVSRGQPILIGAKGKAITDFGRELTFGVANPVILMLSVFAIVWFLLHFTAFGRLVTAIGSNEEAVRLSGINIGWYIFAAYVISGGLSALAGGGFPDSGEWNGIGCDRCGGDWRRELDGWPRNRFYALLGVLILAVIGNIMNLKNVPSYHQEVIKGVIILAAVLFQSGGLRRRGSP
jgi:ribose transport system permease protein